MTSAERGYTDSDKSQNSQKLENGIHISKIIYFFIIEKKGKPQIMAIPKKTMEEFINLSWAPSQSNALILWRFK